ncbi:MAG: hypothetical protein P4M11_04385 [Candidatus Pacebacteria bacterium]|nr:hypothetical protein [Candidatus Paceibacterota bacterium]
MANALLYYAVLPVIVSSLCSTKKAPLISINTALFLIYQTCSTITYKPFLESLVAMIFLPSVRAEWQRLVEESPDYIPLYSRNWVTPASFACSTIQECNPRYFVNHI